MVLKRILFVMAAATLALLSSCSLLGGDSSGIIGNIFIHSNSLSVVGGTPFHVRLYSEGTVMDPYYDLADYTNATPVASFDGVFPGTGSDDFSTTNFQLENVPEGVYFLFVWVDLDENGTFDFSDDFGFFNNPNEISYYQPAANIIVPAQGVVNVEVWVGEYMS